MPPGAADVDDRCEHHVDPEAAEVGAAIGGGRLERVVRLARQVGGARPARRPRRPSAARRRPRRPPRRAGAGRHRAGSRGCARPRSRCRRARRHRRAGSGSRAAPARRRARRRRHRSSASSPAERGAAAPGWWSRTCAATAGPGHRRRRPRLRRAAATHQGRATRRVSTATTHDATAPVHLGPLATRGERSHRDAPPPRPWPPVALHGARSLPVSARRCADQPVEAVRDDRAHLAALARSMCQ